MRANPRLARLRSMSRLFRVSLRSASLIVTFDEDSKPDRYGAAVRVHRAAD